MLAFQLGLQQELQGVFLVKRTGVADRNGTFDYHNRIGIYLQHQIDDFLDVVGVKEILGGVIVGRCSDDDVVCILISRFPVKGGCQVQLLFCKEFFDVLVLYRRYAVVYLLHFFGNDIHSHHFMVLCQQRGHAEAHIARSGYCNLQVLVFLHTLNYCVHYNRTWCYLFP